MKIKKLKQRLNRLEDDNKELKQKLNHWEDKMEQRLNPSWKTRIFSSLPRLLPPIVFFILEHYDKFPPIT